MSDKKVLVQIGKDFFELKLFKTIATPSELTQVLNDYDVKLLKEE